jgi:integrase
MIEEGQARVGEPEPTFENLDHVEQNMNAMVINSAVARAKNMPEDPRGRELLRLVENGAPLFWLSKQLGHSSEQVTREVYGHWSREGRKREVKKLEGVFKV